MEPELQQVELRVNGRDLAAELALSRTEDWGGRGVRLVVVCEVGQWAGLGPDIFSSLRALMADLERNDGRIGLVGAMRNAWASGMQRDMGAGRNVYLLSLPRSPGRPAARPTLDAAPLNEVGTTIEQGDFQAQWMPPPQDS